jgi:DNA-binding transcriptional regulator YiaG
MNQSTSKPRGGHNIGKPSPRTAGRGPVYEIRVALQMTQQQLADEIGCGIATVQRCEATGTLPNSRAVQSKLHELAPLISEADGQALMEEKHADK